MYEIHSCMKYIIQQFAVGLSAFFENKSTVNSPYSGNHVRFLKSAQINEFSHYKELIIR